ncbi:TIM50 essential component of the translocase-like protein of the inner mitochondrial membrane [Lipomyces arxii]|uniref:TIM50 essential component of the translocase-like protein of the inner mitochondrial membrane n=1 Tax=Lipomyces arxii TaxID=56418 RepID=UPI0034CEF0A1
MSYRLLTQAFSKTASRTMMSAVRATAGPQQFASPGLQSMRAYASKSKNASKSSNKAKRVVDSDILAKQLDDVLANKGAVKADEPVAPKESAEEAKAEQGEGESKTEWASTAKRADYQAARDARITKRLVYSFVAVFFVSGVTGVYMCRNWDEDEWLSHRDIDNGYTPQLMYKRLVVRLTGVSEYYTKPSIEPILPDAPNEPANAPKRPLLIVGVEDVLIHSTWTRKDGWKTYKRPGMDYFTMYLAQYYDIVPFSSESATFAERTVMKLDPYHAWMGYAFFRESTYYSEGHIVKDISNINRDLSRVIMVDCDPDAYSRNPQNAIPIPRWDGNPDDKELIKLIPLLEYIAHSEIKDVRKIIKSFEGAENFADEYLRREGELRKRVMDDWENRRHKNPLRKLLASLFGIPVASSDKPMIPQDVYRQIGTQNYQRMREVLDATGDKLLAEEKAREKELLEQQKFTLGQAVQGMVDPAAAAAAMQAAAAQQQASQTSS